MKFRTFQTIGSWLVVTCAVGLAPPGASGQVPMAPTSGTLAGTPISVADAIEMVRIEDFFGRNDRFVAFSPDGSKFATVVSYGDLERNVNVFSLLVFDVAEMLDGPRARPAPVLSIPFQGDTANHNATPIDRLTFLADNRTVAFLGTLAGEPRQVYAIDTETKSVRALTNHPTAVKAYDVAHDGAVRLYAVAVPDDADTARVNRYRWDGFSPYDREVISPPVYNVAVSAVRGTRTREVRQYFVPAPSPGGDPILVFDSRQSRRTTPSVWEIAADTATSAIPRGSLVSENELDGLGSFSVDPTGRYAVMWPYILGEHSVDTLVHDAWQRTNLFGRSLAAYFGLVDLSTGSIMPLLDQLFVPFLARDGDQLWAPNGNSVLIKTLLPLDSADPEENERRAKEPPLWLEVDVPSGNYRPVPVPDQWRAIRWDADTGDLILRRADSLAVMRKDNGSWGSTQPLGVSDGFNRRRPIATNGRVVIGVMEAPTVPPDLAVYNLSNGAMTVLTDLNPQLREREYGDVSQIQLSTPYDSVSTATLIKPVGFESGRRYPLIVLHKNERDIPWDRSYLIDGRAILSGHAIQPLAASGFMVLFIGEPRSMRMATPMEGEVMRVNIEEAIRSLAERGYVDTLRVGVSGFSRSAYYVDHLLIHSEFPFAAASQIDGGTREYNDRMRPYTDEELRKIETPLLFQSHGPTRLIYAGSMADRMKTLGKPIDLLYFHMAPHATRQPHHRWRSLSTHLDWWRFWLQDYEDPDPSKRSQYELWRNLRTMTFVGSRR